MFAKHLVFITLQSIGENESGKTGHSKVFYFFEALLDHFEALFVQGFNFTPYHRH